MRKARCKGSSSRREPDRPRVAGAGGVGVLLWAVGIAWAAPAFGYETDPYTKRHLDIADSTAVLDREVNAALDEIRGVLEGRRGRVALHRGDASQARWPVADRPPGTMGDVLGRSGAPAGHTPRIAIRPTLGARHAHGPVLRLGAEHQGQRRAHRHGQESGTSSRRDASSTAATCAPGTRPRPPAAPS